MSQKSELCNLQNCFMFEEDDAEKPGENVRNSSTMGQTKIMEFRADKPYRFALYFQPSTKRKINITDSKLLANVSKIKRNRNKENLTNCKQSKMSKPLQKKVNVALFDDEIPNDKSEKNNRLLENHNASGKEQPKKALQESILSYINVTESEPKKPQGNMDVSSLPKTKQKKVRRSYQKKYKEYADSEKAPEPPSDEILKEMDVKKITRSKMKKPTKEEQEFEKWAKSMNSAFDDVDKFELSISYD